MYYDVVPIGADLNPYSHSQIPTLRDILCDMDPGMPKINRDISLAEMIEVLLEMFALADRFMIPSLSRHCVRGLSFFFLTPYHDTWWRVKDFVDSSEIDCTELRSALLPPAVKEVKVWCEDCKFQDLLRSDGDFAVELVRALAK